MTPVAATNLNQNAPPQNQAALPTKWSLVKSVAIASFKEFAISMALVSVAGLFVATSIGSTTLLMTAIAVVALNTIFRAQGAVFAYKLSRNQDPQSLSYRICKHGLTVCNYLAPLSFSVLDGTTRDALLNEAGRAGAAALLYKNAHPQIEIIPLQGGVTRFTSGELTRIGNFFGPEKAARIVAGAAAATASVAATIQLAIAHKIRHSYPTVSRYLQVTAIVSLANHVLYTLSRGSHPILSSICIVALPIFAKLGLYYYDQLRAKRSS